MTPLMMLALTLPPSIAFMWCRLVDLYAAGERKLAKAQEARIELLEQRIEAVNRMVGWQEHLDAELKRVNEQVTTLSERVYRQ